MATPLEWLNEFQVNTGTANIPPVNDPHIIGLSNGNILVAWTESGTTGVGTQTGTDIIGKKPSTGLPVSSSSSRHYPG